MVRRYVSYYSHIITENLAPRYIRFPQNENEMTEIKNQFLAEHNFPGILGVIDGTHIAVTALPLEIENAYVNRKGFHSIKLSNRLRCQYADYKHKCQISGVNT